MGILAGAALEHFIARERSFLELSATHLGWKIVRPVLVGLTIGLLAVGVYHLELVRRGLATPEVQPSEWGETARVIFHTLLAGFLVLATVIDLDCYIIPDVITIPGILCGVLGATILGDVQIAHLWVDWSLAIPQLRGPYIPAWYDQYRHLHGFAWSLAGLIAGGGLTLLVRALATRILGREGMGFGDVTLMAMIGSFLGWQPVILTFALAPLTGLAAALIGKLFFNRPFLPYGPCLSAAALVVLSLWKPLWAETRLMFSDLVGLAMLAGIGVIAMALLLTLLRLYRSIPTGR